jgi:hypothetical protein
MQHSPDVGVKVAEVIVSLLGMAMGDMFPFTVIGTNAALHSTGHGVIHNSM